METRIKLAILILALMLTAGCLSKEERAKARQDWTYEEIASVIQRPDEPKEEAVKRWLWNLMNKRSVRYPTQLKAAELWLLMNGHIKCLPDQGKEE